MTKEQLKNQHPELFKEVFNLGKRVAQSEMGLFNLSQSEENFVNSLESEEDEILNAATEGYIRVSSI